MHLCQLLLLLLQAVFVLADDTLHIDYTQLPSRDLQILLYMKGGSKVSFYPEKSDGSTVVLVKDFTKISKLEIVCNEYTVKNYPIMRHGDHWNPKTRRYEIKIDPDA